MRDTRHNGSRGFTIVEVVVVVVLMGLVVYPMARVVASSLEASNNEFRLTHAAFLAQMKIEETRTRAACYSTAGPICPEGGPTDFTADFNSTPTTGDPLCLFPAPFEDFKCTVQYYNTGGAGFRRAMRVRVWHDTDEDDTLDADEPSVFLETTISKRPPDW
ncbi:MAG TPA: prepilin-type N-terminal cleavage/methylation domain-containing protein [bacterium]|nr:prepilin-type N-terminal cleavage/methylation domain-containing protein [bacterium]